MSLQEKHHDSDSTLQCVAAVDADVVVDADVDTDSYVLSPAAAARTQIASSQTICLLDPDLRLSSE